MSRLWMRDDGFLVVDCEYDQRSLVKEIGGHWDGIQNAWTVAFTLSNLEFLIDNLDCPTVDPSVEKRLFVQEEKEARLSKLREMSKQDVQVKLRVPGLKAQCLLYNYQKLGVVYVLTNNEGVLIADEMGLGKTLQAIAAALIKKFKGEAKNCLVITPASLKFNWPIEIAKFTDEKFVVIDGSPSERIAQWMRNDVFFHIVNYELILEDLFGGREYKASEDDDEAKVARKKAMMEKAGTRKKILSGIRQRVWDIITIDEAHSIKSHHSRRSQNVKKLNGRFRIALTGTPMDGRLEELHSVMEFVYPGLLESRTRFLQKHAETDFWGKITGYKDIETVRKRIAHCFIRRLKKDVLKDLPDKIYENRMVVLTAEETRIYKSLASRGHVATQDSEALVAIIRCKQFCDHGHLIDETNKTNSKLESLREVLDEIIVQNGHKVLVFSQYRQMLEILVKLFDEMGLKYLRIDGGTPKQMRADMQKRFNEDKSLDLMVGTEAMSAGLNFTAADYVINYDDNWAPAVMAQREDRCIAEGELVFCLYSEYIGGMGIVAIQNIGIGDSVLTHTGKTGKVVACRSHEHRGMITTIEHAGWWEPLVCTYDHKILVKREGGLVWIAAHDVLPSDSMVFPKRKDTIPLTEIKVLDSWRLFPPKKTVCIEDGCNSPVEARQRCYAHYRKWLTKNRGKVSSGKSPCGNGRHVSLPEVICIDDAWLRLFGWYVAEGFSSVKEGKGRFVSLSGHQKEEGVLTEMGKVFDRIGVRWSILRQKKGKGIELRAYSGELARWFMSWFGHGAKNKRLPKEILCLPPNQAAVFLRGYTDGDGYQRGRQVEWVSASRDLCYQMCLMAIKAGFIPTMRRVVHPKTHSEHFIGCYTKFGKPSNSRLAEQDDDFIYRPVTRVETRNDKIVVHDLTVDSEDHSFTIGFASVHNCHRIGQKKVVTVVNFVCKDTIEERIRDVLYGKSVITAETMGDEVDEMVLRRLGPKDIAKLL